MAHSAEKMPVYFLAHGSPMNAIEDNYFVADWHNITANTPRPKAIVVISAHWETRGTKITAQKNPETIHDFGGFPPVLFAQQYPAKGSPELAQSIQNVLAEKNITADLDHSWGLDHGSWVILKRLYPNADIPVLQISLDMSQSDFSYHIRVGQALQPLRKQGVLFIGSGNIVHNIAKWFRSKPNDSIAWAKEFDDAIAKALINRDSEQLVNYHTLPYANEAVPTAEHYLPLLTIYGLSDEQDKLYFSDFGFEDLSTACSRSVKYA